MSKIEGIKKYQKKPVVIETIQWTGENWFNIGAFVGQMAHIADEHGTKLLLIDTLKGQLKANIGDWIIKGVKGEFYPRKPDIFEQTYQLFEPTDTSRLLTDEEINRLSDTSPDHRRLVELGAKAQLALDHQHEQARVEQIFKEIEELFTDIHSNGVMWTLYQKEWQALKKKYSRSKISSNTKYRKEE